MCTCALITAWWCGHAALSKLRQRTDIRSNAPNPSLSPRVQLCCQIKEGETRKGERCIHFCLCGRICGVIFEQAGQGRGSLVGEVGQLRSEWRWEWDSQVNASDHRGIRECPVSTDLFGPRSINHWVFVYPDKFSFNKWWHQATRSLFFFRRTPS